MKPHLVQNCTLVYPAFPSIPVDGLSQLSCVWLSVLYFCRSEHSVLNGLPAGVSINLGLKMLCTEPWFQCNYIGSIFQLNNFQDVTSAYFTLSFQILLTEGIANPCLTVLWCHLIKQPDLLTLLHLPCGAQYPHQSGTFNNHPQPRRLENSKDSKSFLILTSSQK